MPNNPNPNGPTDNAGTDPNNAAGEPTGGAPANGPTNNSGTGTGQKPTSGAPVPGGDGADDLASLSSADLAKMVRELRRENGADRTNAKQAAADTARQELAQEIGRALGLVKEEGEKADPNKLAEQLQSERRERLAEKAARRAKLDADALLDSRGFARALRKLDPSADDFTAGLDALVKEYKDDPRFKTSTGQAPARSGGDFSGGPGAQPTFTREQIARMSSAEYAKNRGAIMAQLGQSK
jgi:hypothetical protein